MKLTTIFVLLCASTANAQTAGVIYSSLVGGSGQDFADAVTSDASGNTYVAGLTYSSDFPVTTGAYQTVFGGTCDAFIAKLDPNGKPVWATYLGGILDDWATAIALDGSGNVWVAGWTRSSNFPLVNPIESVLAGINGDNFVAFVAELDPTGSKLLYSTFLGGVMDNGAAGMTLDSAGNVYVAVNSDSETGYPGVQNPPANAFGINVTKLTPQGKLVYNYFHQADTANAIAVDSTGAVYVAGTMAGDAYLVPPTGGGAFVYKISPDGSTKVYEKIFGGSYTASANAIAVNGAGDAWIGGSTGSADFPVVSGLQTTLGARPIWQSTNSGATWSPLDNLPFALPEVMVVDPSNPTTLYEATGELGVFKSTDGGATWTQSSTGISGAYVQALAIDPVHTQTLYAATSTTVYNSTNGAATWTAIDTPPQAVIQIEVDGQNPNIVYEVAATLRKSTDGGDTWSGVIFPGIPTQGMATMVLDPQASGHLFAISQFFFCGVFCNNSISPELYRSVDGGNTWTEITAAPPTGSGVILVDTSTNPSTIYDGLAYRSSDGGVTWTALPAAPFGSAYVTSIAVDPSGTLYATPTGAGIYASHDHGQTWTAIGSFLPTWTGDLGGTNIISMVGAPGTANLYATVYAYQTAGFVSKLSADGSTIEYSTYLRGHPGFGESIAYESEPGNMILDNWISGIALDGAGNVVVTGGTRASDFPTANPAQAANAGRADAFAAVLSPDGSKLNYATYFGGSQDDGALIAAVDSTGNVILAGQTGSSDFPTSSPTQAPGYGDAFVVKLATGAPAIGSVLNGASFQAGIESGSWAMIKGVNLANITRTWTNADFNGPDLPTALSGVSVTIDGNAAFVSYISPTQINVVVPSDSTLGNVQVVVENNGLTSAPATVQLESYAPAFFWVPGTPYVIASRLPNYAAAGTPSAPAHAGDTLVLWATGLGPTTPAAPAGIEVSGAPPTSTMPIVTVGGVQVQVISSVLAPGTAGLYQINIQLPANVPTGTVAVQASIGGMQTQSGVTLVVE